MSHQKSGAQKRKEKVIWETYTKKGLQTLFQVGIKPASTTGGGKDLEDKTEEKRKEIVKQVHMSKRKYKNTQIV